MIKDILKHANLFVNERGYAGRIKELTPPKLSQKMLEYEAGGLVAPVDIPTGMLEKLEAEFTLASFDRDTLADFGVRQGGKLPLTIRAAMESGDGEVTPVLISMRAFIRELDMGNWKAGDEMVLKASLSLTYYRLEIDGEVIIEVDPENMVLVVNGQDQLADVRTALGF